MKILDAGHKYVVDGLDGGSPQIIIFVKRDGDNFPFNFGHYSGTNCQEVLRVLIDRTEYLLKQKPCAETEAALGCLKTALLLYELRAARRHEHFLDLYSVDELMYGLPCKECGHIKCEVHSERFDSK